MGQSVPSQGKTETPQKTSDSLGNLRVDETNVDGAPEATLERVPCIRYPTTFREKSVSTQEVRSMPYTLPSLRNWASESGQSRKIP